ncbi:MAG: hypothetical protein HY718_03860, partial [Planctomycetes bacterium]|nr:hypothetical protein [Planctomycetota bacterium]
MRLCDRASFVRRMSLAVVCGVVGLAASAAPADQWYKGNTHTHTWWSDGDSPPEVAVKWYKEHGYAFLVLSDHNVLSQGDKWVVADAKRTKGLAHYNEVFPNKPLPRRERDGKTEYRLTTLDELRATYQTPGGFLLVQGEEISDQFDPGKQTGGQSKKLPIHLNGFNLKELVPPQGGKSVTDTLQRNIDAVLAQ